MERRLLKTVRLADVLSVVPLDTATQVATADEGGQLWALWEFDHEAIGEIGGQEVVAPHNVATVSALKDSRREWMNTPDGAAALAKHAHLLNEFAKGDFLMPPVVIHYPVQGWVMHIRDGAHRIFAAYEHTRSHPERRLRVYWNRVQLAQ